MFRKILVIGLALATLGFAQGKKGGGGGGGDMSGGGPMPSGAPSKWDTIANTLNLTKDQKKTVRSILDEGSKESAGLRDQISKARIALADAMQAKKSDDEIKQATNGTAELTAQLDLLEMRTFAKIVTSLDETQKANRASLTAVYGMMHGIYRNKNWNED